jgi:small-conductance mechanosensitive channel
MALIRLLVAPIRRIVSFPLFQLIVAIAAILVLQASDSQSVLGQIFSALDWLVDYTVRLWAAAFEVKSFTRSWLVTGFMIAYVYLAGLLILFLIRLLIGRVVEFAARRNAFGLTNAIARERGIAAYRAWEPLERIRPAHIPQAQWEEQFAWPADNRPPYPSLARRILRGVVFYTVVALIIAALLQAFTPFPVLTWLGRMIGLPVDWLGPR